MQELEYVGNLMRVGDRGVGTAEWLLRRVLRGCGTHVPSDDTSVTTEVFAEGTSCACQRRALARPDTLPFRVRRATTTSAPLQRPRHAPHHAAAAPVARRASVNTTMMTVLSRPTMRISNGHRLCEVGSIETPMIRRTTTKPMSAAGTAAAIRQPPRQCSSARTGITNPHTPSTRTAIPKRLTRSDEKGAAGRLLYAW